jgi:hypothetical protein
MKVFTVAEANALLPRLETVMSGLRQRASEIQARHEKVQILDALWGDKLADPATPDHAEFVAHGEAIERLVAEVESTIEEEILGRGIRFPQGGIEQGLLDFPSTLDGRAVYLCWRSGERRVLAWHEVDGGFAGRHPVTPDVAARLGSAQ